MSPVDLNLGCPINLNIGEGWMFPLTPTIIERLQGFLLTDAGTQRVRVPWWPVTQKNQGLTSNMHRSPAVCVQVPIKRAAAKGDISPADRSNTAHAGRCSNEVGKRGYALGMPAKRASPG